MCVVLLKRLLPVLPEVAKLSRRFRCREASAAAIHCLHTQGFEFLSSLGNCVQVRMKHSNKCPPQKKIETAKRDESRRIVKHQSSRLFQHAPLFEKAVLHQIAQAVALLRLFEDLFQRLAPLERSRIRLCQNRPQNARDVSERNFLLNQAFLLGGGKSEILHKKQVDLVAIGFRLIRFAQMALNQRAQALPVAIQNFRRKLAQLESQNFFVQRIEPFGNDVECASSRTERRQLTRWICRFGEAELDRQGCIEGIDLSRLIPPRG